MLLDSLICLKGRDTGLRIMAVTAGCYSAIVLWVGLFGSNASALIPAFAGAPVLFLTGQRRCRDAGKPQWAGTLTQVPWWLLAVTVSVSVSAVWWLVIALTGIIGSMLLAVFPSRGAARFEYGYHGPATADTVTAKTSRRVEPSLNGEISHAQAPVTPGSVPNDLSTGARSREVTAQAPLNQKQWLLAGAGVLSLVVIGLLVSPLFTGESQPDAQAADEPRPEAVSAPEVSVSFRDGFKLSLQGDKLSLSWLGDDGDNEVLWDLADAKGDRGCRELRFNNGAAYRPMKVERLADQNNSTQAEFTPLDTQAIIKDIARRGKMSLCGYTFSLKGSRADMSKNRVFRAYIE